MGVYKVEVKKSTLKALNARSKRVKEAIQMGGDRQELLSYVKARQNDRWKDHFDNEGDEYGGRWKALNTSWTVRERGNSGPILQRDGSLRAATFAQAASAKVNKASIRWELTDTDNTWGASHHTGYKNPIKGRKRIPARIIWEFDQRDEDRAANMIEAWFRDVLEDI